MLIRIVQFSSIRFSKIIVQCAPKTNLAFCQMNTIKRLLTGPEGNSELCFPRISMETKFTVPQGTSH